MILLNKIPGSLLIFLGALCLSFGGIIVKSFEGANLWQILFWRQIFFSIIVVLYLLITYKKNFFKTFYESGLPGFTAGVFLSIGFAAYVFAMYTTTVANTNFIITTETIFLALLGYFFLKEKISNKAKLSISIVIISILYLLLIDYKTIPWVGLLLAILWSVYNLLRKKINVDTDIGLLIESLFIFPFVLVAFYIITKNNFNDFDISNPSLMIILMLAGPMTVIPLFLYVRGVELCGLGPTGMIFYITPTLQFLLGYFLFNEPMNFEKLLSFLLIWIAVFIYLKDLYEKK